MVPRSLKLYNRFVQLREAHPNAQRKLLAGVHRRYLKRATNPSAFVIPDKTLRIVLLQNID
ncbi:hypothetical protein N7532_003067 [Penicillium argentinense]|uniref:Uncharacterized protein n=1 Tax=Penicillium argentinense TaxID=1131581 RepID=A0A9W9KE96_9EURO|nr:uncharacterized protein N7532_003067 [Penicillium argentinense]KAJ5102538.1 hypothetical protein N7532_003067 [Penicillium argentinense]